MTGLKQNPAYEPADLLEYGECIPQRLYYLSVLRKSRQGDPVHGHGQCSVCHTVIDECCRGEQIEQTERKQKDHDQNIQKDPAD